MKKMYNWSDKHNTFITPYLFYSDVSENPKANARIKKKAEDILKELASRSGWPLVKAVKDGTITFEMWYAHASKRTKRNIKMFQRRSFQHGLQGGYRSYLRFVYRHYSDIR